MIAAALWDDLLSLFLIALLLAAIGDQGTGDFALGKLLPVVGKVLLFFAITIPVGLFAFPWLGKSFRHLSFPEVDFRMLLIAAIAYAVLAEFFELHPIIGAFMAVMFFHPKVDDRSLRARRTADVGAEARLPRTDLLRFGGLSSRFQQRHQVPVFVVVFTLLALASKLIGSGVPAYWAGFSN